MKNKKIISSLLATLLAISITLIDHQVKADEFGNQAGYYVTETDNPYQAINYFNEQHHSLHDYIMSNVNEFVTLSPQKASQELNRLVALAKQAAGQLVAQLQSQKLSPKEYNDAIERRNTIHKNIQNLVNQESAKINGIQQEYNTLVNQRNQAVNQINTLLKTIHFDGTGSVDQVKAMFQELADRVNPLVENIITYKNQALDLQSQLDNYPSPALEAEIAKLTNKEAAEVKPLKSDSQLVENADEEKPVETEDKKPVVETDANYTKPEETEKAANNTVTSYDQLKAVLKDKVDNRVPTMTVNMELKSEQEVQVYQQKLGDILRELGNLFGTTTQFSAQTKISLFQRGGQVERVLVSSDIAIEYTIKQDQVALSKEYKNFVANFVKENITDKNITSDYEKAKIIHDHIVNSYEYATEELQTTHETVSGISVHAPEALYKDKRGVCQAYAVMFRDMAVAAGLDAWYVTGKADIIGDPVSGNHAWNIVKIDGTNYYVDATWNDTARTNKYFLAGKQVTDEEHTLDPAYNDLASSIPNASYRQI
ncbi:transglutaminase domain-containing protein [Streptococcus ictaluri]|uniref:Transglutaminase-like protein n=1 Tax=Streptococcus ictaluri 707-05 TaxID=764299 RepID=G5K1U2_9STRE|nr:transglutaminase domain-containing protein [Streptococcus ictaluri]EHI70154.1 transglutaminase-like protein [Streptococcus ictaluri 707-05]